MSNVISLQEARRARDAARIPPSDGPLEVDFSDILRMSHEDAEGRFIDDVEDPIILGHRAAAQLRQLFWRFGLRRMPATWGELLGNFNYCRLLSLWMARFDERQSQAAREVARLGHNARTPHRGDVLALLARGDGAGAWKIHQAQGTFDKNAADPFLTAD